MDNWNCESIENCSSWMTNTKNMDINTYQCLTVRPHWAVHWICWKGMVCGYACLFKLHWKNSTANIMFVVRGASLVPCCSWLASLPHSMHSLFLLDFQSQVTKKHSNTGNPQSRPSCFSNSSRDIKPRVTQCPLKSQHRWRLSLPTAGNLAAVQG